MPTYPSQDDILRSLMYTSVAGDGGVSVPASDAFVNPNPWTVNSFAVGTVGPVSTTNGWSFTKASSASKMLWYMYNPTYNTTLPWTPSGPRKRDLRSMWAEVMFPAAFASMSGNVFFSVYTYSSGSTYAKRYNYETGTLTVAPGCWYVLYALDVVKTTALGTTAGSTFQASMPASQKTRGMKAPIAVSDDQALWPCSTTRYVTAANTVPSAVPADGTEDEHVLALCLSTNTGPGIPDGTTFYVRRFGWSRGDELNTVYRLV